MFAIVILKVGMHLCKMIRELVVHKILSPA